VDTDELTESGGVIVPDGLCVSVGLQRGICLDNLFLERPGVFRLRSLRFGRFWVGTVEGVILQNFLRIFRFSSA
jgi:hypothetical protein